MVGVVVAILLSSPRLFFLSSEWFLEAPYKVSGFMVSFQSVSFFFSLPKKEEKKDEENAGGMSRQQHTLSVIIIIFCSCFSLQILLLFVFFTIQLSQDEVVSSPSQSLLLLSPFVHSRRFLAFLRFQWQIFYLPGFFFRTGNPLPAAAFVDRLYLTIHLLHRVPPASPTISRWE